MDLSTIEYLSFDSVSCIKVLWKRVCVLSSAGHISNQPRQLCFFFFLQKEEQILFILDHKEACPSLPHSSKRNSYVLDIFQKIAYTHIYVFCWIGFF